MSSMATMDRPELVMSPPVVMAPRPDGFEVVWAVSAQSRGWVEWRLADEGPDQSRVADCGPYGFVPQGSQVLRIRLDGLTPGQDHLIRTVTVAVDDGHQEVSDWKPVRTLDPSADSATFLAWNDTHQREDTLAALDDASPGADVWVWNGDVCNNWNDPAEIVPTILSPAGRDVTAGRPMMFGWGNHDVRGPWAHRVPEVVASPYGLPYHGFRIGPVAAIVLSTGEDKPDDHPSFAGRVSFAELRRRQADWLAEQIKRPGFVDAPYRVVFCHMPLRWLDEPVLTDLDYESGKWDHYSRVSRELWHDALVEWGTQIVVSGHTHRSALIEAEPGAPYVQLTGGGNTPDIATWIEGRADRSHLRVTAHRLDGTIAHQVEFNPLA